MPTYDIDLLRALMVDKLNDNSIFLASFYEQIQDEEQITRYVDSIKELIALQNSEKSKSGYKAMGIISQSGSADILNIKQNYIVPLEYQVRLDIEIGDRDYVLGKIKQLILDLKGRKFDVIQLTNGNVVIPSNTPINTSTDKLIITPSNTNTYMMFNDGVDLRTNLSLFNTLLVRDYQPLTNGTYRFYFIHNNVLFFRTVTFTSPSTYVHSANTELGTIENMYKISVSFNGIQSQEPYINNGVDRVFLFFGGNATIVDNNVVLGNDIVETTLRLGRDEGAIFSVEPTELTGSLDVTDDTYPTWSTGYQTIDRNMAIANKVSYSFVFNRTNSLYNSLYMYGRYGENSDLFAQLTITAKEYRLSFGRLEVDKFYAKLGSVNTQNTNGDVMTISILLKVGAY
jgi:hypothetical protein